METKHQKLAIPKLMSARVRERNMSAKQASLQRLPLKCERLRERPSVCVSERVCASGRRTCKSTNIVVIVCRARTNQVAVGDGSQWPRTQVAAAGYMRERARMQTNASTCRLACASIRICAPSHASAFSRSNGVLRARARASVVAILVAIVAVWRRRRRHRRPPRRALIILLLAAHTLSGRPHTLQISSDDEKFLRTRASRKASFKSYLRDSHRPHSHKMDATHECRKKKKNLVFWLIFAQIKAKEKILGNKNSRRLAPTNCFRSYFVKNCIYVFLSYFDSGDDDASTEDALVNKLEHHRNKPQLSKMRLLDADAERSFVGGIFDDNARAYRRRPPTLARMPRRLRLRLALRVSNCSFAGRATRALFAPS